MKVSFKIGAIAITSTTAARELITHATTAGGGATPGNPIVHESANLPAKAIDFKMDASEINFECEVGEVAGVYKEMVPMFKDMMDAISAMRNSDNNREVAIAAANAVNTRTSAATAAFVADQQGRRASN